MKHNKCITIEKAEARIPTVIDPGQKKFNGKLPLNKQYHTLCASQSHSPHSEIIQLTESGLITMEQYYGIDYNDALIQENKNIFPQANFKSGDFYNVLSSYENFNPGIIYYDSTGGIEREKENIGYILNLIQERDITNVLMIFNVIMKHRAINHTEDSIINVIESDSLIQSALCNDDKLNYSYFPIIYKNGNSNMFTLQFTR